MFSRRSQVSARFFPLLSLITFILAMAAIAYGGSSSSIVLAGDEAVDGAAAGSGIVASVVKAPIVPDGDVAGAPTDIVITLDRSLDPAVEGRSLLTGRQIKITLPDAFVNTGAPVQTIFTPGCVPPNLECSSGIFLQGWPQHPIFPMFPPGGGPPTFYETTAEGTHTFVFTALQDVVPGLMLPGPGIKQIHLFAVGFVNPSPGRYAIDVMAQTGPGGAWERGTGHVHIRPHIRPSINVTSVFNGMGNPNSIYQNAGVNSVLDFSYDFLLWDRDGAPFTDVDIRMINGRRGQLRQGNTTVGQVFISAPKGATGQTLTTTGPSVEINSPISAVPTGYLKAFFTTGDETGLYTITFSLNGGNSVTMFVTVE